MLKCNLQTKLDSNLFITPKKQLRVDVVLLSIFIYFANHEFIIIIYRINFRDLITLTFRSSSCSSFVYDVSTRYTRTYSKPYSTVVRSVQIQIYLFIHISYTLSFNFQFNFWNVYLNIWRNFPGMHFEYHDFIYFELSMLIRFLHSILCYILWYTLYSQGFVIYTLYIVHSVLLCVIEMSFAFYTH